MEASHCFLWLKGRWVGKVENTWVAFLSYPWRTVDTEGYSLTEISDEKGSLPVLVLVVLVFAYLCTHFSKFWIRVIRHPSISCNKTSKQARMEIPSLKLTVRPWKWMVGIRSFPFGALCLFSGVEWLVSFREGTLSDTFLKVHLLVVCCWNSLEENLLEFAPIFYWAALSSLTSTQVGGNRALWNL